MYLKVTDENVNVKGSKTDIQLMLTSLMNSLYTKNILTKEDLSFCVDLALKNKKELEKLVDEKISAIINKVETLKDLKNLFDDLKGEDENE